MKEPTVYILTNKRNGALYTGVTSNLPGRMAQHKGKFFKGFTQKYGTDILVWYKSFATMREAIWAEKALKNRTRKYKIALIEEMNPSWKDLAGEYGRQN